MEEAGGAAKVPLSFWIVAGIGLLWNGFASIMFWLTATKDPDTMAQTPPAIVEALAHTPGWAMAAWGLAVSAALAGSVLLMLRRRWAVPAFAASLGGLLVLTFYQVTAQMPMSLFQVVMIWLVALFLLRFSSSEAGKGLLR
ncbi:MAG: hypothetical protein ACKOQM_03945 [Novosphingobium sp.]